MNQFINNIYGPTRNELLARVIKIQSIDFSETKFFTTDKEILQCGVVSYQSEFRPKFHSHLPVKRSIVGTSESLYILSGKGNLQLLENPSDKKIINIEVGQGDLINLLSGAHRIVPKDTNLTMLEVKNGPYVSRDQDKKFIDR